jgi:hypothetical protein
MGELLRYAGQALFYAAAAALSGYLATHPVYEQIPDDHAQIKLSFSHGGERKEACRTLTPQEIAKLPRGEKRPNDCSGERVALRAQVVIDDALLYDAMLEPTGFSRDGPSHAYEKFIIPAGRHEIMVRLRDTRRNEGFDYEQFVTEELKPMQNLAIDFRPEAGGFNFR